MAKFGKLLIGLVSVIFMLSLGFAIISAFLGTTVDEGSAVIVALEGELPEVDEPGLAQLFSDQPAMTMTRLERTLRHVAKNEAVAGVVLEIRDPQVSPAQLAELSGALGAVRESGKWIEAFVETAGEFTKGDGAYALATIADKISMPPPSEVNLVGYRAEVPFLKGVFEKLDVGVSFKKRHAYKNSANTFTEAGFTPEHRQATEELLTDLQESLVDHIAQHRAGHDVAEVKSWFTQGPRSAEQALEQGLIDYIEYFDQFQTRLIARLGDEDKMLTLDDYAESISSPSGPQLAYIIAQGTIHRGPSSSGFDSSSIGSSTIAAAFRQARKDEVGAVVFRVDSPGGSYIASDLIRREVAATKAAGIPVIVSMGTYAASGGYFVAMDADHIFAQPQTLTGSIGVYSGRFASRRLLEKLGMNFGVVESSKISSLYSGLDLPDAEQEKLVDAALDRIYHDFVSKAADGRGKTYDELHAVAQGRVWTGRAALERGLIDELGGIDAAFEKARAMAKLEPGDGVFHVYPRPKQGLELLADMLAGVKTARVEMNRLRSAVNQITTQPQALETPFLPEL